MKTKSIHPFFSYLGYIAIAKLYSYAKEYQKENLVEPSYIFAPNHTNNFDGYLIWSLLSKDYDIDVFMFKEFWNNFPKIAPLLSLFHVYPITRDTLKKEELETEIEKLKNINHSLIMFPEGRHVDPRIMFHFEEQHLKTIPLGAFYLSAVTNKPVVPIYMEPQKRFQENAVIYGTPLYPKEFDLFSKNNFIKKKNLLLFAKAWLKEINKLYENSESLCERKMKEYPYHPKYFDATGKHHNTLKDPNRIIKYLEQLKLMEKMQEETGIDDLETLCLKCSIPKEIYDLFLDVHQVYKECLVRHK